MQFFKQTIPQFSYRALRFSGTSLYKFFVAFLASPSGHASIRGLFAGLVAMFVLQQVILAWGLSFPVVVAMLVMGGAGFLAAQLLRTQLGTQSGIFQKGHHKNILCAVLMFALSMSLVFHGSAIRLGDVFLASLPAGTLIQTWSATIAMMAVFSVCITIPVFILTLLACRETGLEFQKSDASISDVSAFAINAKEEAGFLCAMGVGFLLGSAVLLPLVGAATLQLIVALTGISWAGYEWWRSESFSTAPITSTQTEEQQTEQLVKSTVHSSSASALFLVMSLIFFGVITGAITGLMPRYVAQIMPSSSFVAYALVAGLCLGCGASRGVIAWRPLLKQSLSIALLLLSAFCAALILGFPQQVELSLWSVTTLVSTEAVVAIRVLTLTSLLACLGFLGGWVIQCLLDDKNTGQNTVQNTLAVARKGALSLFVCGAISGYLLTNAILVLSFGVAPLLVSLAVVLFVAAVLSQYAGLFSGRASIGFQGYSQKIFVVASCLAVVGSVLFSSRYNTEHSAQLLFSSRVFQAYQTEMPREFLLHLNDARHLATVEGEFGTLTAWNHRASQLQIRQNGIPKGIASRDTMVSPQYSAEVMHAVIPLVMHESPREVLVLGYGAGTASRATLQFPVTDVCCLEADSGVMKFAKQNLVAENGTSLFDDSRFHAIVADPILAVASLEKTYDVILSSPDHSALQHAGGTSTKEFYQRVARRLDDDGIFCQRFASSDYGQRPVQITIATLRSVFPHVMMFDVENGELSFVASKTPFDEKMKDLISRADSPQVKHLLAEFGWDWSVLLNMAVYHGDAIAEFTLAENSQKKHVPVNSVRNGILTTLCPLEVINSENHWSEKTRAFLEKNRVRLMQVVVNEQEEFSDDSESISQIKFRLKDINSRHQMICDHTDVPWAYRKLLKEKLSKSPRSKILPVRGEGLQRVMHPEDKQRVAYLEALGDALRAENPSEKQIQKILSFKEPYDPIVSEFLHVELARLYRRMTPNDYRQELKHRMHAINFSSQKDRSIHSVLRCLEILEQHEDAVPTAAQRWDYVNSLLFALQTRWEFRYRVPSILPDIEQDDVNLSIAAITSGCNLLVETASASSIDPKDAKTRCAVIERYLLKPLQTNRSRLRNQKTAAIKKEFRDAAKSKKK